MTTMELTRNVWWSKAPELTGHDKIRNGVEPKGIDARPTDMIRAGMEKLGDKVEMEKTSSALS